MYKDYFAVAVHEKKTIIDGVVSILPNLNGVLLETINGQNLQISEDEVSSGLNISIEYYDPVFMEIPDDYSFIDCTK